LIADYFLVILASPPASNETVQEAANLNNQGLWRRGHVGTFAAELVTMLTGAG
jgi:hypothetical protein